MARPVKWRKIEKLPQILRFYPDHKTVHPFSSADRIFDENILKLEELEAVRLKDLEGFEQEDCAVRMEVSRPTFQRILMSARKKITDSLVNGKSIRIEGGHFTKNICQIRCESCGREWIERYESIEAGHVKHQVCPKCHLARLSCCPDDENEQAIECRRNFENRQLS